MTETERTPAVDDLPKDIRKTAYELARNSGWSFNEDFRRIANALVAERNRPSTRASVSEAAVTDEAGLLRKAKMVIDLRAYGEVARIPIHSTTAAREMIAEIDAALSAALASTAETPFAWYWYDATGCLIITGDDRQADIPDDAKPLYTLRPARRETWEEAAKVADDYGLDALPDSEYRLACTDLAEAFRARATEERDDG